MTLHIENKTNIQLEVVTEFGRGGVLLKEVRSEEDDMWGVKIEYLHEDLLDSRFKQILAFPTLEQAQDVFNALRARPKQCTCHA